MPSDIDLTLSIVSYNTCQDLLACLQSIYAAPPSRSFDVVVVDNGSTDGSVEQARARFPQVRVIETGENLGYGRANNRGLLGAEGRYYAILNSDLVLKPGSLDAIRGFFDEHDKAGIVGGALLNADGSPQMNWAAGELTVAAVACEQLFLAQAFKKSRVCGDYFRSWWRRGDTRELPQVCGAFLVVRAELFNRIGGFDPSYFMYCEDTDLCKRVRAAGFSCVYLHTASSVHGHGKSSAGALRARMVLEHNASRVIYMRKFLGPGSAKLAKAIMCWGSALRIALWTILGALRRRSDWIEKGRAYREVLRGTRRLDV